MSGKFKKNTSESPILIFSWNLLNSLNSTKLKFYSSCIFCYDKNGDERQTTLKECNKTVL